MTWFKVDDSFWRSRKVRKLGDDRVACVGLWTLSGDWSADNLTDGFIPWEIVEDWDETRHLAKRLIQVGLWLEAEHDGEQGVAFHDWGDWQPTREQVEHRRKADAERRARWRESRRNTTPDTRRESHQESRRDTTRESRQESRPGSALPDPTRPDPTRKTKKTSINADAPTTEPDRFDEFWGIYPRRTQKIDARKAWDQTLRRKVTPEKIIAGAKRYARERAGQDPQFTKHPASWLRAGGYDDEPDTRLSLVQAGPELRTYDDYRRHAAGEQAARLLRKPYIPEPQPPGDRTHPRQWARDQAAAFVTTHEQEIRAALAHQETA